MPDAITGEPAMTQAPGRVLEFAISGMDCGNCARHVTEAIQGLPEIHSATVSLDSKRAAVRWNPGKTPDASAVVQAVSGAGYGATVIEKAPHGHASESDHEHDHDHGGHTLAGWQATLWIGVLGTAPMMIGEWVFGLGMKGWFQWVSFVLAFIVQVFAGAQFYRGAWKQLKVGNSNMDTLVALGSTTAFAYSTWALLSGRGGHVYFMEAASIITLISLGHWMESRVSLRASSALRRLLNLAPPAARRRNADGTEVEVPVGELKAGDLVSLRPGDRVPTDGTVIEGDSAMDEAMLTGESTPVDKAMGSQLYAGTVAINGRLLMKVTALGEETALAHIIAAVQRAQSSRANIQRLGDRVSSVFVPIVVAIAAMSALWWGLAPASAHATHEWLARFLWNAHPPSGIAAAFIIASAVLIIACPCAMGLATPAAIMAGSNAAAQRGILIRDGVALEKAGTVTTVVFDKTGTLTAGKPSVAATSISKARPIGETGLNTTARDFSPEDIAAALSRHSSHPISQAISKIAAAEVAFSDWQEIRGSGVSGRYTVQEGRTVVARLGSLTWFRNDGISFEAHRGFIEEWSGQGATLVALVLDREVTGMFAVKDTIKAGTRSVVRQLQQQGLRVCLLTGDNATTAAGIARQAGIEPGNVFAEVRPEQKAEFVKNLQRSNQRTAFVGDGINDAPALEQADLGIAVGQASDVAREAADIILLKSEIEAVPEALGLAKATLRTIKQNLFWAFFYNAVGIPLAALGFMSPILCAAAMGFSDMIVIGNALRLRRWKLK